MFTGIVEELGSVQAIGGHRLRIHAGDLLDDAEVGDSIAVNGCCLTVTALTEGAWEADLDDETLERTTLGDLRPGDPVNLDAPSGLRIAWAVTWCKGTSTRWAR